MVLVLSPDCVGASKSMKYVIQDIAWGGQGWILRAERIRCDVGFPITPVYEKLEYSQRNVVIGGSNSLLLYGRREEGA